jgi:hypothetical protein
VILTCEERGGVTLAFYVGKEKSKRRGEIWRAPTKRASWGTNHVKLETRNLEATSGEDYQ